MDIEFIPLKEFLRNAKRLKKKYPSFQEDLENLKEFLSKHPHHGDRISEHLRKVRLEVGSKTRGKSHGARLITCDTYIGEIGGKLFMVAVYDKAEASSIRPQVVEQWLKDEGLV